MAQDLRQRRELSLALERHCRAEIAQRRCAGGSDEFDAVTDERQLVTAARRVVAERAEAVERIAPHGIKPVEAAAVRQRAGRRQQAGVVKLVIRQQRAVVTLRAPRRPEEQPQSAQLRCVEVVLSPRVAAA